MNSSGKLALGVLAAAATGAILGVLFAPSKGAVLRRKMKSMGAKEVENLKDKYSDFAENVSKNYEKVKDNISDFANKAMSKNEAEVRTAENN